MAAFRKKPVVIEAVQWRGGLIGERIEIVGLSPHGIKGDEPLLCQHCGTHKTSHGWIETLEGGHIVCPGDWIITGVSGEHYPCKPDIFAATYEPA